MDTIRRCLWGWTVTLAALTVTGALFAQTAPPQVFEARIKTIASLFKSNPSFRRLLQTQLENLVNFIVGNMLFVLNHEIGHVIISDFRIPVLARAGGGRGRRLRHSDVASRRDRLFASRPWRGSKRVVLE